MFLFGMLVGACSATQPQALAPSLSLDHQASASALESKTVALVKLDDEGKAHAFCSGVWVSERTILTARHCVDEAPIGEAVGYLVHEDVFAPLSPAESEDMRPRAARVSALDEDHDLALLHVALAPKGHGIALVHEGEIHQGSFAQAMGHSLGLWYSYSTGIVSAVREKDFGDGTFVWVQTTTPVSPGNSGGGLFDAEGRLLGVCHAILTKGQALNLFVHAQYVSRLLATQRAL